MGLVRVGGGWGLAALRRALWAAQEQGQMSPEDLAAAGVGEDLVRISVGLEDPRDIIEDLERALKASQR